MELLIVLAALVGLVWFGAFVLRGPLLVGAIVFLLLNACFGVYYWAMEAGPIPLTLDRLALGALLGAYVVQIWLGRTVRAPLTRSDKWLIAFLLALGISTFTHDFRVLPEGPPDVPTPLWHLLTGYISPALLYWLGRGLPLDQRQSRWFLGSFALFGIYLGVTGVFEIHHQWSLVYPQIISHPDIGLHYGRARGPLLHSVAYGFFLTASLVGAWLWWPGVRRVGSLLLLVSLPIYLAGIYYCYTRSVWLGAAVGMFWVILLPLPVRFRPVVLVATTALALAVGIAKWDSILGFQRDYSAEGTRDSVSMRGSFAYVSWLMFLDHPLVGCGFGQYIIASDPYLADRSSDLQLDAIRTLVHHNMFLSVLTETGLVGLALFTALAISWFLDAWRVWTCKDAPRWVRQQALFTMALLLAYLMQVSFHEVSYLSMMQNLLFLVMGMNTSLCLTYVPKQQLAPVLVTPRSIQPAAYA
ncbi:MAG: O-antigen ligase family protein [Pirellulales bacterium]|nr:O-antigen ligase family protein [Pirellulales bacterium]